MKKWKISALKGLSRKILVNFLLTILLVGCITIEVPANSNSNTEPQKPRSVQRMENLGYSFIYFAEDDPYWEANNSTQGWTFRVWENGAFGMSGQFNNNYTAQTEASIDFFKSLNVSPEQADLTNFLVVDALGNENGESASCANGLCCNALVVPDQDMYLWYCEAD